MIKVKVTQPRCTGRDCYEYFSGPIAKKVKGAFLKPGYRYCTGGKRIRQFKSRDPKVTVPSWCPIRKSPAIIRIYCYKNSQAALLRLLIQSDKNPRTPMGHEYAMRYEGTISRAARELDNWEGSGSLEQFLGIPVHAEEIVEIDDGLNSYYFYIQNIFTVYCISFDGEKARQNKLEVVQE